MAEEIYANKSDKQAHHLALSKDDAQHNSTIYKLRLSMKRRFSPEADTPSPEGAAEVRDLLRRLVEIDNESRALLMKVLSLLEKDEKLEIYVKERIEDPRVSRMWQLIEQVLACQEGNDTNYPDVLIKGDDNSSNFELRSIEDKDEMGVETRIDRFKVKNLGGGTGSQGASSSTAAGAK